MNRMTRLDTAPHPAAAVQWWKGAAIYQIYPRSFADANGDGKVDWKDGFYVLDGFGGIHAIGGADPIEDSPFLGFDIARDLDF